MHVKKSFGNFLFLMLILTSYNFPGQLKATGFLRTRGKAIVDANGDTVFLRGIGLGGWLVPEGYQLQIPGFGSPSDIRNKIVDLIGEQKAEEFYRAYRANYVSAADIDSIAKWGFNSVRLPFNYRLISPQDQPGVYLEEGFAYLDSTLAWCKKNQLYLILDMHCAPGGQNSENISDSDGIEARLWTDPANQDRTVEIWKKIAERYADEEWIAGYDLLNEPVLAPGYSTEQFRSFYVRLVQEIRTVDANHIVFIEGNWYGTDFTSLDPPFDQNMVYTFHKYWSTNTQNSIQSYIDLSNRYQVPLWMGESGENSNSWFYDAVQLLENNRIGWCWWTHKKVAAVTCPYSAVISPWYQQVLDYWNGEASRPSEDFAYNALMSLAENLKTENCLYRPGVLPSLFDPEFGTKAKPLKKLVIPGTIACSDYDLGKEGIAYHDVNFQNTIGPVYYEWNSGWEYRNDGVDIEKSNDSQGAEYNVGWIEDGEWLSYSIQVESSASYLIRFRVASPDVGGKFQLLLDGEILVPAIEVPKTDGWQNWHTIEVENVQIESGSHQMILKILQGGFNINQMSFSLISSTNEIELNRPIPDDYRLEQNYPNPFKLRTFIDYALPEQADVEISLFNSLGQLIGKYRRKNLQPGWHRLIWDKNMLTSGVYFYQMHAKSDNREYFSTKRMYLIR